MAYKALFAVFELYLKTRIMSPIFFLFISGHILFLPPSLSVYYLFIYKNVYAGSIFESLKFDRYFWNTPGANMLRKYL